MFRFRGRDRTRRRIFQNFLPLEGGCLRRRRKKNVVKMLYQGFMYYGFIEFVSIVVSVNDFVNFEDWINKGYKKGWRMNFRVSQYLFQNFNEKF